MKLRSLSALLFGLFSFAAISTLTTSCGGSEEPADVEEAIDDVDAEVPHDEDGGDHDGHDH